jgi:hypothetical protein
MVRRSDQEVNCKSEAASALPPIYPSRECVAKDSSWFQQGMMIEARPSCVRRFTNQCRPFFSRRSPLPVPGSREAHRPSIQPFEPRAVW